VFQDGYRHRVEKELSSRAAQIFQHEYDHTVGKYVYPVEDVSAIPSA
jgi:peptide deformylase